MYGLAHELNIQTVYLFVKCLGIIIFLWLWLRKNTVFH